MHADFMQLIFLLLGSIMAGLGGLILFILSRMADSQESLARSTQALNEKMAVIVEKVNHHDQRLTRLETIKG